MKKFKLTTLLILVSVVLSGCIVTTTNGRHVGYVSSVEKNGIVWKTGRAYLKTDTASSQEDFYCVESEEILNGLGEAAKNKQKIEIFYHDELIKFPWRCAQEEGIVNSFKIIN